MDKNFDKIAAKLQKCLTLAEQGATDGEKQAAAMAAQRLMNEYNLTIDDLPGEKKREVVLVTCQYKQKRRQPYQVKLAHVVTDNFRCKVLITSWDKSIQFFGFSEDANAAKAVFEFLYHEIYRGVDKVARELAKNNVPRNGECRSYTHGFIKGLKDQFDAQCLALMVIVPEEVKEQFTADYGKAKKSRAGRQHSATDVHYYEQGRVDGTSAMRNRELEA